MRPIKACELPADALLRRYLGGRAYADCYATGFAAPVSHAEFVTAFYTTRIFKLERLLLSWFAKRPSNDAEVLDMAHGRRDSFAAWNVEGAGPTSCCCATFRAVHVRG